MDIDAVLGSLELPTDRPHWETALLAQLSEAPPVGRTVPKQKLEPIRSAAILPFKRPSAT